MAKARKAAAKAAPAKKKAAKSPARGKAAPPRKPAKRKAAPAKLPPRKAAPPSRQAKHYADAIERFQRGRYAYALGFFKKAMDGPDAGLKHRATVYARICQERTGSDKPRLKGADEYYHYGVKLVNDRDLDGAEPYLKKALKLSKNGPHVYYALAVLNALKKDIQAAASNLREAIAGDPRNRLLARTDGDLTAVIGDPAIAGLLKSEGDG